MTRYKLNIDKPGLSDEKINKHKDFKKLMYNYQRMRPLYKTPIYKDKKAFLVLLLVLLIVYLITEFTDKKEKEGQENKVEVEK